LRVNYGLKDTPFHCAFLVAKAKSVAMESHKHFVTSNTKKCIYRYTLNQF
jgi:hypothetical protein